MIAKLRVCASCEWIFKLNHTVKCPRCGFGSYGAHYVYGNAAYRYAKTQKPWIEKRLTAATNKIMLEAQKDICCWRSTHTNGWQHDTQCKNYVVCF